MSTTPPLGTPFAYGESRRALQEQMHWIDALDTKAAVLLASAGVITGLVLSRGSPLSRAPRLIAAVVSVALLAALVSALLAFATRRFETAPDLKAIVAEVSNETQGSLPVDGIA